MSMDVSVTRQPPVDLGAEKAVVASIIIMPTVIDDVAELLTPDDFYDDRLAILFRTLIAMHADGKIDERLLVARLKKQKQLESIGGTAFLADVFSSQATAAHAVYYARIVYEKATLRRLIEFGTDTVREAYEESEKAEFLVQITEQRMFEIAERSVTAEPEMFDISAAGVLRALEARAEGKMLGLATGFTAVDDLLTGLHPGELIVVAGRPAMGKSAFAANIAEHVALVEKRPVLFVTLEMSKFELTERILLGRCGINAHKARRGHVSVVERQNILDETARLSQSPLAIDDDPGCNVFKLGSKCRKWKRKHGLDLLIVDYLQLMEPADRKAPRQEQVAHDSRQLKRLAKELQVPIVCVAQLNRVVASSKDTRPHLHHLRESGAIEQDADAVLMIHRDEYYMTVDKAERAGVVGKAVALVRKQRHGPTGEIDLVWRKEFARFGDIGAKYLENYEPAFDAHNNGDMPDGYF